MVKKKDKKKVKEDKKLEKTNKKLDKIRKKEARKTEKKSIKAARKIGKLKHKESKLQGKLNEIQEKNQTEKKLLDIKKTRAESGKKKALNPNTRKFFVFLTLLLLLIIAIGLVLYDQFKILIVLGALAVLVVVYLLVKKRLKIYDNIKKMELAFPDFIALMAANLRAGMTIDRALLMSARKEFAPLDGEITQLGKDIVTGKEISKALLDMSERINSEEIKKTVLLIISGIRSGGNLSVLLEQVSSNMRERVFVKKKASSNVLMYVIFIFFAVSIGSPVLFGLSSVLVDVLTSIVSSLPSEQASSVSLPFSLTGISVSSTFIFYFALVFMVVADFFAALVLGLVGKGKEREGLKFLVPMILLSITVFYISRSLLLTYFGDFLG